MSIQQSQIFSILVLSTSCLSSASESPRPSADSHTQVKHEMPKAPQDKTGMGSMEMGEKYQMVMPFFTHMGMPEPLGSHSLNLSGLLTSSERLSTSDVSFQYMCGLSDRLGVNFRSDEFTTGSEAEVMFQ